MRAVGAVGANRASLTASGRAWVLRPLTPASRRSSGPTSARRSRTPCRRPIRWSHDSALQIFGDIRRDLRRLLRPRDPRPARRCHARGDRCESSDPFSARPHEQEDDVDGFRPAQGRHAQDALGPSTESGMELARFENEEKTSTSFNAELCRDQSSRVSSQAKSIARVASMPRS